MSTTLSLQDEELAEQIRETEGSNNAERLRNWALQYTEEENTEYLTETEIESLVERKIEEEKSRY